MTLRMACFIYQATMKLYHKPEQLAECYILGHYKFNLVSFTTGELFQHCYPSMV